jgi:hypothetical protein
MPTLLRFPAPANHAVADGATPLAMNLVLAYENLSAALWATERLKGVLRAISRDGEPRLSPWSFSTLENPALRDHAAAAGRQADLVIVATSSMARHLPAAVESWLARCLSARGDNAAAVVAFLGCGNQPDPADSPRLQTVQRLTHEAGCDFFSPGMTGPAEPTELSVA